MRPVFLLCFLAMTSTAAQKGVLLEDLTWVEAEHALQPDTVVVIPIGAESKEHGPHLRLRNDFVMAEYFKKRILQSAGVVVAPTVNYHYYPAFLQYPGSTSLRMETARDVLVDICHTLAAYGPKRFYALNTGVSTMGPLKLSAEILAKEGILFRFTNILEVGAEAEKKIKQEAGGTHADEIETSLMLYIDPDSVDMAKAVKDFHPHGKGGLTRDPNTPGTFSASGIYGDATLATRAKGEIMATAMLAGMLREIEELRAAKP